MAITIADWIGISKTKSQKGIGTNTIAAAQSEKFMMVSSANSRLFLASSSSSAPKKSLRGGNGREESRIGLDEGEG